MRAKVGFAPLVLLSVCALADSPLTSTPFAQAYMDLEIVRKARSQGVMSLEIAQYLSSPSNPVDAKAAVVNALGWDINGKSNAVLYSYYLALSKHRTVEKLPLDWLSGDELLCLGYLTALDDYFHPEKALPIVEKAAGRKSDSLTVRIVLALVRGQCRMSDDWPGIWKGVAQVLDNDRLKADMRPQAVKIIVDYMKLYE